MADVTWDRGPDLVGWSWELPLPPPEGNGWVVEWLLRLRSALRDFGQLSGAWTEHSHGDDRDFVLPSGWEELIAAVRGLESLQLVYLYIDLRCLLPDGGEVVLPQGATLSLSLRRLEDGKNNAEDPPLLGLSLHTDIYDPDSSAGDNEETGALNAPRLRQFLERIEATGAVFDSMEKPFAPRAHRYGFC
jgi:hypothetical protein